MHANLSLTSPDQDGLEASPVVVLEAPEHEPEEEDWEEEEDELPGTDDEELEFDEYDEDADEDL